MRRIANLWQEIVSFENLYEAWLRARRGKMRRPMVAHFALNLEHELLTLQRELRAGTYSTGGFYQFTIYDRKLRTISAAPFRDRVLQQAVMGVLEPQLDRSFIDHSYACRKGKGIHRLLNKYQSLAGRNNYILSVDVKEYFPSINHSILYAELERRIADPRLLLLLQHIISSGPARPPHLGLAPFFPEDDLLTAEASPAGLPIGNFASQVFANVYLDVFDHWIQEQCRPKGYLRYVDDMWFFDREKQRLWDLAEKIQEKLISLRLQLHSNRITVRRATERLPVLGFILSPKRRWLSNQNGWRYVHRYCWLAGLWRDGAIDWPTLDSRLRSWHGHAMHGQTNGLRQAIYQEYPLKSNKYAVV